MTTQDILDDRYGRTRSPARRWIIAGGAAVAILVVAGFGWLTVQGALDDVGSDATAFEIVDERTLMLAFQVSAPRGRAVACVLEARDEEHGVVGWRVVEYPASDVPVRAFREEIPTTAEATTGLVNSCWVT